MQNQTGKEEVNHGVGGVEARTIEAEVVAGVEGVVVGGVGRGGYVSNKKSLRGSLVRRPPLTLSCLCQV